MGAEVRKDAALATTIISVGLVAVAFVVVRIVQWLASHPAFGPIVAYVVVSTVVFALLWLTIYHALTHER